MRKALLERRLLRAVATVAVLLLAPSAIDVDANELSAFIFASLDEVPKSVSIKDAESSADSWFDKPEFRIRPEIDIDNISSEKYSLRFRPTSLIERRSMSELERVDTALIDLDWRESANELVLHAYRQLVDLAQLEFELAMLQQRIDLYRAVLDSEQSMAVVADFDPMYAQNTAARIEKLERELRVKKIRTERLRTVTVRALATTPEAALSLSPKLISPAEIASHINSVVTAATSRSFSAQRAELAMQRTREEARLARARSGFGVDLLELSYEDKRVDSYMVTVGFRLPFGQDQHRRQRKSRSATAADDQKYLKAKRLSQDMQRTSEDIIWHLDEFEDTMRSLDSLELRIQDVSHDARAIGFLKGQQLDLYDAAGQAHLESLRLYIKLVNMAGLLMRQPVKNWIASEKK